MARFRGLVKHLEFNSSVACNQETSADTLDLYAACTAHPGAGCGGVESDLGSAVTLIAPCLSLCTSVQVHRPAGLLRQSRPGPTVS